MSRQSKQRKLNNTIAVIADGQTEKWYLERVKVHYPCEALKSTKIEPQLPQKKQIAELVRMAKAKVEEGYPRVILLVDFDEVLSNAEEFREFQHFYQEYRKDNHDQWMNSLMLVVNNPCLEYWYLLHFNSTGKFYSNYSELEVDLHKKLSDYNKGEKYYCGNPDIYTRLDGNDGLTKARNNAKPFLPFDIQTCRERGVSEMSKIFDYFDSL